MRDRDKTNRGLGPFTGAQLTIVIVAICAAIVVGAPVAALAAGGAFTSNSATVPAVKATNSNPKGIGVQGTGKKYGVLSNGPLGVAAGKALSCSRCVSSGAISPIDAYVDGTEITGHHLVSVSKGGTGIYALTFDRDIHLCTITTSTAYNTVTEHANRGGDPAIPDNQVLMNLTTSDGTLVDSPFGVLVTC